MSHHIITGRLIIQECQKHFFTDINDSFMHQECKSIVKSKIEYIVQNEIEI